MSVSRIVAIASFAAGLLLTRSDGSAQSFTFVAADTVLVDTLGSEVVFNTTVHNTGVSSLTLAFVRTLNDLPADWQSSMCFALCFAPFVDSIATTSVYGSSPLNPGDSRLFSVHVFPLVKPGTGVVRVVAKDVANPSDQQVLTLSAVAAVTSARTNADMPCQFSLSQNYPNPFNGISNFGFSIADFSHVSLKIFNVLGQEVATLVNDSRPAGSYVVRFDASALASGTYFYRLHASSSPTRGRDRVSTKRLLLLK